MEHFVNFMGSFFDFLTYLSMAFFALTAVIVVSLALPNSQLRAFCLQLFGRLLEILGAGSAAVGAALILSPIDAIPDFIPFLGWGDDVMMFLGAAAAGLAAFFGHWSRTTAETPTTIEGTFVKKGETST